MKKILGSVLTMALVLSLMMIPGAALADNTDVSGQVAETPTVTSILPTNGDQGATLIGVQIGGTNFQSGAAVSFNGTGITVTGSQVDSSILITANITINNDAAADIRDVIVTQGGKTGTGTGLFTVNAVMPTITSLNPNNGNVNTAPTVVILGTNFVDGQTTINVSGTGVSAGAVTFTSSTNISATFTIAADAAAGARSVTVTVAGKQSNAVDFTVNSFITVTAPSAINLGAMAAGATTSGASSANGTVTTNTASWQVTARDEKGTNTGFMINGGSTPLTNKFQVSKDNSTWANADTGITYNSSPLPFYGRQAVIQADPGGSYTITITFTGSVL